MTTNLTPQQPAPHTTEHALRQAIALHQAGKLEEAGEHYLTILQDHPDHPEANHRMGMLAVQMEQPVASLHYFAAALDAAPSCGQYWLSYIDALFQAGRMKEARQVLALARQQGLEGAEVEALAAHMNGDVQPASPDSAPGSQEVDTLIALFNAERLEEAATLARELTVRFPEHWLAWKMLGVIFNRMGRSAEALVPMQKAVMLLPGDAEAHYNLGITLRSLGRLDEAETSIRKSLELNPGNAVAHNNLGNILQTLKRTEEAAVSYRQAIQIRRDYAEAHYNLGNTLYGMNRLPEAESSFRNAIQVDPDLAEAYSNLGITLKNLNRFDEARACLERALEIEPDYANAYNNLGIIFQNMGRLNEATSCYQRALQINPDLAVAHTNLGFILNGRGLLIEAETSHRRALQISPDIAEAHNNLGNTLKEMSRLSEAEASYRRALQINPSFFEAHSNLLFLLNYLPESNPASNLAEARQYGHKAALKAAMRFTEWTCNKQPERLHIGFVSGDFVNHAVGYFIESLLTQLDSTSLELIAYPTIHASDELTERIKPCFSAWKPLAGLNDEAAAQLIHNDGIHVLMDLSGHTSYNRLPLFAWKPAPVQVSWLGYLGTTGIAEIDYLIADPWTLPEAEEVFFTEKIWRLPETYLCFTPPDVEVEVSPLPALENGYVTFGCFNNLAKINDEVVALWSKVLAAVPDSRLFIKARQFSEASVKQGIVERFAAHGIGIQRLILESATPQRAGHLAAYRRMDIALDPFPYPGITTSVESLWMGVPLLTLAGKSFLSRQGVGILMNVGLPEWIAGSADDYIDRAVSHASDLQRLSILRGNLRQQVLDSPLMDARRFAIHFETALKSMWYVWREKHPE